jgi:uncharacterized protein (DUF58 family)
MRLTRRGAAVVAVVVFASLQGYFFGQRALNFVAAPGIAAILAGAFLLRYAEEPTVERSTVRPGFPGEERSEAVSVAGSGIATVSDTFPAGIEGETIDRIVSLPVNVERELRFRRRGLYSLGGITVRQRDPLGLLATEFEFDAESEVAVYPEIYELDRLRVINSLAGGSRNAAGQAFDWLREYQSGDPLRRVHWKSTAKHGELLVADSELDRQTEPIHVVVDGPTATDELAAAAASVVFLVSELGFEIALTLPDETVASDRGQRHRERLLFALARTGERSPWGRRSERFHLEGKIHEAADVLILDDGTVTVRIDDEAWAVDQLRSGVSDPRPRAATATTRSVIDG